MPKQNKITMHPLLIINEWRKGCSCAINTTSGEMEHPSLCSECTDAAMQAIEQWFAENPQWKPAAPPAAEPEEDEGLDPLFNEAVQFVVTSRKASISGVQREFRIGYNRAARIIEQMEDLGVVSQPNANGNRDVLPPSSGEM